MLYSVVVYYPLNAAPYVRTRGSFASPTDEQQLITEFSEGLKANGGDVLPTFLLDRSLVLSHWGTDDDKPYATYVCNPPDKHTAAIKKLREMLKS